MKQSKLRIFVALSLIVGCFFAPYLRKLNAEGNYVFTGYTMGTQYNVKLVGLEVEEDSLKEIKKAIEDKLAQVNRQMSTYDPESEISHFNNTNLVDEFEISAGFAKVMGLSRDISEKTAGAFDPTVSPLIDIWGFGYIKKTKDFPDEIEIQEALKNVGFRKVSCSSNILKKAVPNLQLNLSAIAKGYGVDVIAGIVSESGFTNYMVEIGGEVITSGLNQSGEVWRIGVQNPAFGSEVGTDNVMVVILPQKAIATSGDYRNYFEYKGKTYSHVIDPRTGYPTESGVASASVIADTCMMADALATALMVMGPVKGLELIENIKGVEAVITVRNENGFSNHFSSAYDQFVSRK